MLRLFLCPWAPVLPMLRSDDYQISIRKNPQNSLQNYFPLGFSTNASAPRRKKGSAEYVSRYPLYKKRGSQAISNSTPRKMALCYDTEGAYKSEN